LLKKWLEKAVFRAKKGHRKIADTSPLSRKIKKQVGKGGKNKKLKEK
jgi:hypothetical protein